MKKKNPRPVPPKVVDVPDTKNFDLNITDSDSSDNNKVSTPDVNRPDVGRPTRTPLK